MLVELASEVGLAAVPVASQYEQYSSRATIMQFKYDSLFIRIAYDTVMVIGVRQSEALQGHSAERSVNRGEAALNSVSQSATEPDCLQRLERRLDISLLDRSTRPRQFTEARRHTWISARMSCAAMTIENCA